MWKRSKWTRSAADSKERRCEPVDRSEWVVVHDETLRIVSDELWEQVKAVQTASNPRREAIRLGVAKRQFRFRSKYLLGGTLVCGVCGSNYIGDGRTDSRPPVDGSLTIGRNARRSDER